MMEEINDADYYRKFHGVDPVFIFSHSRPGRALPKEGYYREMWETWEHRIPGELKTMFIRTFETGAGHPEKRPDAKAWMKVFSKLARQVAYCPECRYEMFTDGDFFDCPICKKKSRIPGIRVHTKEESYRIPFYKNQEISPFEVEGEGDRKRNFPFHDGLLPIAKVVESNGKPYLVNLDPRGKVWTCSYMD